MPDITQPSNIPAARREQVRVACGWPAFRLLRKDYPFLNVDNEPDVPLSDAQVAVVFEQATRRLWRKMMAEGRRREEIEAVDAAIQADIETGDPFV